MTDRQRTYMVYLVNQLGIGWWMADDDIMATDGSIVCRVTRPDATLNALYRMVERSCGVATDSEVMRIAKVVATENL